MSLLDIAKRFGKHAGGAVLACVLLLPLPAFAYTISGWQFTDNGVAINDNSVDHKTLQFGATSGGQNYSATAGPPIVSNVTQPNIFGSAGEQVQLYVDLSGLTLIRGTVTVSLKVNDTNTISLVFNGTTPAHNQAYLSSGTLVPNTASNFNFLSGNPMGEQITLSVQFSNNARFTYVADTPSSFYFR